MKIAHILNNFLPGHIAGTEVYAYNLGKELSGHEHEIIFIIPGYGKSNDEEYIYEGLRVISYGEPSIVDRALQMGKRKPDGLINFIEIIRKEKPDIIHFHELAGSNGITLHHVKSARETGSKVVMTSHLARYTSMDIAGEHPTGIFHNKTGAFDFYGQKGIKSPTANLLYAAGSVLKTIRADVSGWGSVGTALAVPQLVEKRKKDFLSLINTCDKTVAISRWYFEALKKEDISENKLYFIEQGIQTGDSSLEKKSRRGDSLRIIFIGRVSHFKGIKNLIEVVGRLASVQLDIYGDAGEDPAYINECRTIAESFPDIQIKGSLPPGRVISVISGYDLLILPSTIHEMSPLVIREAFAAGVPVLASDSMGSKEQITEGKNGWFFKMNDWNDLREKLQWLSEHPEEIAKANQFPPVRSFKEVAEDYEKVYGGV